MSKAEREKRGERLQLMLTNDEVEAVDTWRFEHRMPSRSAAVRALVRLGLDTTVRSGGSQASRITDVSSDDIGILTTDPRVEAALGSESGRAELPVFASDPIVAHGLRGILADAGIDAEPLLTSLSDVEGLIGKASSQPLILALDDTEIGLDEVSEIVSLSHGVVLVCLGTAEPTDLPDKLRGVHTLSRLSVPDSLVSVVNGLLKGEAQSRPESPTSEQSGPGSS
ncbi:hypothetical protein H0I76_13245 [Limibaculum sp. M0105]|uniref:Uncharacterized protein n=1 Tax=Thermohalobaculum xanthum TaxID=2753746 RepID=A0A8J7M9E7_9RHOB|nr:hypothetical protein [Thermohalobaculum xanthum]MBK0400158.1 hypothetical protein [Thermohalobaculum xanthum]